MLGVCARAAVRARPLERAASSVVKPPCFVDCGVANEPILSYCNGSVERAQLQSELCVLANTCEDIPIVICGEEIREGKPLLQPMPHNHQLKIAQFYHASEKTIEKAIDAAVTAQKWWDTVPLEKRVSIWECAAQLIACTFRQSLNAATMCGQSKTVYQAEIDAACELVDFIRFNNYFLMQNAKYQPLSPQPETTLNSMRFRGIDGFVAAISPFNFTAIGGNLAYTPALMGNGVIWKPSDTAILSNWRIFNIMRQAGVPDGVVNFVPADGPTFGKVITSSARLAGINFTGSVPTFNWLWNAVGNNINNYYNYPRLVGEVGGKNFHFVHCSADVDTVVACTIRSAFEYTGQKCSACSRLYIPKSLYCEIIPKLICYVNQLKIGDPADFTTFTGAVIDEKAYKRITGYIKDAKKNPKNAIHAGGHYDNKVGYYVWPTIIETTDPLDKLMQEEIFGPILTVYTYEDEHLCETLALVECTTKFALTGAIFAKDEQFLKMAYEMLKMSAGNFYINDKSTGAVVGQQPFGGGRMSGTNDKAGGLNYVMRWTSPQSIKETFVPQHDICYPYMCD